LDWTVAERHRKKALKMRDSREFGQPPEWVRSLRGAALGPYSFSTSEKGSSMKKHALAAASAAALLWAGGAANADQYLQFAPGVTFGAGSPTKPGAISFDGTPVTTSTTTGWNGNIAYGHSLDFLDLPDWTAQADVFYSDVSVKVCDSEGCLNNAGVDLDEFALALNVLYNINTGTQFTPYIGAGLEARDTILHIANEQILNSGDYRHWNIGGRAIAGVDFAIDPMWSLYTEYRYEIRSSGLLTASVEGSNFGNFPHIEQQSHNIEFGVRLHFE
jgi:opacity protein-like surface antigen